MKSTSSAPQLLLGDIFGEMRSRPGRFALSLFAMSIGMAILTALIALLGGLEDRSRDLSRQLGTNVVAIFQEDGQEGNAMLPRHADLLRANYPGAQVSGLRHGPTAGSAGTGLTIIGVEADYFRLRDWQLSAGRLLDARDVAARQRVAIITEGMKDEHGWEPGMIVPIGTGAFRIVGVVMPRVGALAGELTGEFADARLATGANSLFVPLTVEDLWQAAPGETNPLDAIFVRAPDYHSADEALGGLRTLLAQPDLGLSGLSWVIPASLISKVREMQGTVALTVGTIAALCLLLGGTTLSSILVANVRERVAEIGLRRALGASRSDIVVLFMAEGCLVALGAAFTGSLLTHLVLATDLAAMTELPVALGAASALLPLALAVGIGALFSFLPARAAARINPAQALKFE